MVPPMPDVVWADYQQCDVCGAKLGKPCLALSGFGAGAGRIAVGAEQPHTGRKLRAGAVDRG